VTVRTSAAPGVFSQLADLGAATVHESGAVAVDLDLRQIVAGSVAAGPARLVVCPSGDNRAVHEVIPRIVAGDVVVLSMPEPNAFGVIGELLVRQAKVRGAAAFIVDAGVRDTDQLRALGLPIWARHTRVLGTSKVARVAPIDSLVMGGAAIHTGDVIVADSDGVVVVSKARLHQVLESAQGRRAAEESLRVRIEQGEITFDMFGLGT
jgi:4-hydroxy-4-methyl-2-oxoglutarate aldolase